VGWFLVLLGLVYGLAVAVLVLVLGWFGLTMLVIGWLEASGWLEVLGLALLVLGRGLRRAFL
jgi:hypothetical protein